MQQYGESTQIPVGSVVVWGGGKGIQRFRCTGHQQHERFDGSLVHLAVYETDCRECGASMEVTGWAQLVWPSQFKKVCDACTADPS